MTAVPVSRRTLGAPVVVRGVGLFTAKPCTVRIEPAPPGHGFSFRRTARPGAPPVFATIQNAAEQIPMSGPVSQIPARNTSLADADPASAVLTVEHLLSALVGMGVTDAAVLVEGHEVPMGDGSAQTFVQALQKAGTISVAVDVLPIAPRSTVTVRDPEGRALIVASPRSEPGCRYEYRLNYGPNSPIQAQRAAFDSGARDACENYARNIAPARTFCLDHEARALRAAGLFLHVSPRDMLVIGPGGPIDNAYRFGTEPARHKLLDLIGDLALAGRPLQASIVAEASGHALNRALVRAILAAEAA